MAISLFKITRVPKRSTLEVDGNLVVLNSVFHISKQESLVIKTQGRGVPYDDFGLRLGNEQEEWSKEYKATINVDVEAGTPTSSNPTASYPANDVSEAYTDMAFDTKTDRMLIDSYSAPKYGVLTLANGTPLEVGKIYMLYELAGLLFKAENIGSIQNPVTTISFKVGNKDGMNATVFTFTVTLSANLHGIINGTSNTATV